MAEGMSKSNIDLDKLVNTLLRERGEAAATQVSTAAAPAEEPTEMQVEKKVDAQSPASFVTPLTEPMDEPEQTTPPPKAEKRRSRRRRKEKVVVEERDEWEDWGLTPIGHYQVPAQEEASEEPAALADVAEPAPEVPQEPVVEEPLPEPVVEEPTPVASLEPAVDLDEFPSVQAVVETVTLPIPTIVKTPVVDDATRVVPNVAPVAVAEAPAVMPSAEVAEEPVPEQLPDQLSLEELVRVEDIALEEEATEEALDAEEQLRRSREEKIREFTLDGDDEEVNEPEEEMPEEAEPEEPVIEDFTRYEDTRAVQLELQYRCRSGVLALVLTTVLELVLLTLTGITLSLGHSPITALGYLTVEIFALVLMGVLNYAAIARGMKGAFMFRANNDTAPALVLLTALCGMLFHFLNMDISLPLWPAVAGIPMVLCAAAKNLQLQRVRKSFSFVSYPGEKYTAALVSEEKALMEIGQRVVMGEKEAQIAYFRPTAFLSDYLAKSIEDDGSDDWAKVLTPIFAALSLLASLVLLAVGRITGFWAWMQVMEFMLALSAVATGLAVQLPLGQCSRYMLSRGGFISGWAGVRTFGKADAVMVDVADLYPDESMLLHGIKTFSGAHIDDAILDAAALSIRSGGPLSRIFRRIIQDKLDILSPVDTLVYEQNMGLSGWVDGRRVLVGNRRLLQNHGVDVPSSDYEARYAKNGRQLVYLSTAGELSAMFVVSYLPEDTIKRALQSLCRSKVTLLIHSCDQNVTAAQLCENFELDEYYVDVLPAVAGRIYEQYVAAPVENAPAVLAANGHILGIAAALGACRSLLLKSRIALIVQVLMAVAGLALGVLAGMHGVDEYLLLSIVLMVASPLLTWIIPLFKRF